MDKFWMSENVWFSHHTYATVLEHAYVRWAEFIELSDCGGDAAAAAADGMYVVHKAAYRMNSDRTIVRLRCAFNQKFSISILDFLRWWIHSSNMLESPLSFEVLKYTLLKWTIWSVIDWSITFLSWHETKRAPGPIAAGKIRTNYSTSSTPEWYLNRLLRS